MTDYGEIPLISAPVDPDHPTFNSLLGALKAVHTGEMGMDVLVKYHSALSQQLAESRKSIEEMDVSEGVREARNLSLGAIAMTQVALDMIEKYIQEPSQDRMADCLQSLLDAMAATSYASGKLDENIKNGK